MLRVGIIGFGPRGLSILERLVSKKLGQIINDKLEIYIFDPNSLGSGCHSPKQSSRLLVNTVASQMTIFADETICPNEFFIKGPNFYEFLLSKGYKADKNGYYSRVLLGKYLEHSFQCILKLCSQDISIHIVKEYAQCIIQQEKYFIISGENTKIEVDSAFITTGHNQNQNNFPMYSAYPLEISTQNISANDAIDIKGLGLSAIDVITMLTSGNGGFFEKLNNELIYNPSGKEPKIFVFSRSNLPLMARAITQKETREQYQAIFFNSTTIKKLKKEFKKLNFEKQILPLIIKEMEYVYSYTYINLKSQEDSFLFRNEYLTSIDTQSVLDKYIPKCDQFNFYSLVNPLQKIIDKQDFYSQLITYLENDIKEARLGNLKSPIKSACDVLRDVRDNLRLCVDFGGLDEESYKFFIHSFVPINNRLCVGPPLVKIEELLALIKANVVNVLHDVTIKHIENTQFQLVDSFNNSYCVNRLIDARINEIKINDNALFQSLIANNLATKFNYGNLELECLKIDENFCSINKDNKTIDRLFILGLPTEGIKFYTFILPRPHIASTFLCDSNKAVDSLIKRTQA
ncbi:TPA: FAD/NAD(P)-binding protein [Campylobacter coli]|nr:FAD/NAD(P)-binding protein [Campylobacter coli]HED7347665.1 FAD/NAD(P)-binding protein [Campylobacter coli]HED7360742.1 FAD/NAD(P)-binding protein [Campylobacter coli]HEG5490555.1 FAD/NAD(P)-binding protein [Campylobacter coli]